MATKENPGQFDCYANAKPDEPMFVLLARDEFAPLLVEIWAAMREGSELQAKRAFETLYYVAQTKFTNNGPPNAEKMSEAYSCCDAMRDWKIRNFNA